MRIARRHRHGRGSDRGATLVEAALSSVLVMTVLFGVLEFGLAFKDYLSMASAVRDGARTASTMGNDTLADYDIIQDVIKRMPAVNPNQIQAIVVFKGTSTTSTISTACQTGPVAGSCNWYGPTDIIRPSTDFTGDAPAPDSYWAPKTRKDSLAGPPDYVGVWVKIYHGGITGLLHMSKSYSDQTIMRIEPATVS
jgi:hypothetical protein